MANFEIPVNPEFSEQIRKFETTDPAHADLFNYVTEALLHNDVFLSRMAVRLQEEAIQHKQDHHNPHNVTPEQLGVEPGANNYTHPDSHPAIMITQDENHRFVTDTQKQAWEGSRVYRPKDS